MAKNSLPPRPVIGISTDFHASKNGTPHARTNIGYVDAVIAAGGLPLLIPPMKKDHFPEIDRYLKMCSGVILSGGMDLDPRSYGAQPTLALQPMALRREAAERYLLTKVVEKRIPV